MAFATLFLSGDADASVSFKPSLTAFGHWETAAKFDGRQNGKSVRSFHRDDRLVAVFKGLSMEVRGVLGPTNGYALVALDRGPAQRIDFYAPVKRPHALIWRRDHLTPGPHELRITVLGAHCGRSRGNYVNVDAVDVRVPIHLADAG
jgi:hypothetical protein